MTLKAPSEAPKSDLNARKSQDKAPNPKSATRRALLDFDGPRAFGRLTLLKAIARGGMGEVYLAAVGEIEGAERPCVVKLIRKDHRDDASFHARFLDEARIQAQMHHPGVAQVLEAALDPEGQPYVVVEHIAGRDLAEVRQRALRLKLQLSWADATAIAASVADALAHVHDQTDENGKPLEVAHRDLSPQNIMVGYGGDTKLIDFGTARGENRRCQTINGIVFAKPGYVAPEVASNTPGGAPADLYALGIVLWELIAGRRFLQGDSQEHLAAVAKGERTPPALCLWLSIPKEIDAIIAKLTAPKVEDRFASAREATARLLRVLQHAPSLPTGERGVRARIAHLMSRLYPAEPTRSRAEFADLLSRARKQRDAALAWPKSPAPGGTADKQKLLPGTRYLIERQIASGPMSTVYEAQHVDLGRQVALKVLDRERCASEEGAQQFRREARTVAQLHHDNLVQIHDFGVCQDGRPYYAMEYLDGDTAEELLRREGRLQWREVLDIGVQACLALEAAHARGIVHRDIKPANLLMTRRGTLKLLDFGTTESKQQPEGSKGPLVLVGTPEYMAPEQVGDREVDARADIFALGTVLYELLTGVLPFAGESTVEVLDAKMRRSAVKPSRAARGLRLPRYLDKVLTTALATRRDDRYDDAASLRLDLEWILQRGRKPARSPLQVAAASVAIGVAATTALFLGGALPPPPFLTAPELPERLSQTTSALLGSLRTGAARALAAARATASIGPHAEPSATAPQAGPAPRAPAPLEARSTPPGPARVGGSRQVAAASAARTPGAEPVRAPSPAAEKAPARSAASAAALEASLAPVPAAPTAAVSASVETSPAALRAPGLAGADEPAAPTAEGDGSKPSPTTARPGGAAPAVGVEDPSASAIDPPSSTTNAAGDRTATARDAEEASTQAVANAAAAAHPAKEPEAREPAASEPARAQQPRDERKVRESIRRGIAVAELLIENGKRIRGLEAYRRLGKAYPNDPGILQGWSTIAARTQWWGESLQVATHWARVDRSAPARIHLARTLRRVGQVERALETLRQVLVTEPGNERAAELIRLYGGRAPVALNR